MRGNRGSMWLWLVSSLLWLCLAGPLSFWLAALHDPVLTLWRIQGWDLTPSDCSALTETRREFCLAGNRLKVSMAKSQDTAWRSIGQKWWVPVAAGLAPPLVVLAGALLAGVLGLGGRREASATPDGGAPPS